MNYKERMKEIRTYDLITQKEVAKLMNISESTYRQYESQHQIIPMKYLDVFCNYFNVSVDYILGLSNKKYYVNSGPISIPLFQERLKKFRKDHNLSQEELSKIIKIPRKSISNYEVGSRPISTPFVYSICKKCKISADYLLGKIDYHKNLD